MRIAVVNNSGIRVNRTGVRSLAERLLRKSARRAGCQWGEVSICLADDARIRDINRSFLGHDYPTDVISFTYESIPGEGKALLSGEVIINAAMALRLGRRFGGANRELALYLAHGCDHLSGAEDHTPALRQRMRRRELRWLHEARREGLLQKLWTQ